MGIRAGRYAAIDIGTVTCRMLVADVNDAPDEISSDGEVLQELDREYVITNLGEGVDATGVLRPEAMERVTQAIDGFLQVLDKFRSPDHPHISITAMATSATRDARNAQEFSALLAERGVKLSVIPGQREAALSFLGVSHDFSGEDIMVVDVGGGSTEVITGRAGTHPCMFQSFNIGCRRITEKFFATDPPSDAEVDAAHAWIREEMEPFFARMHTQGLIQCRMVAVAGTATSVVSMHEHMEVYDTARVHKAQVSCEVLDSVCEHLRACTLAQRKQVVGLDPGRASVIVAGLLILQEVMSLAGVETFTVSESDLLQGIILDAADAAAPAKAGDIVPVVDATDRVIQV